MKVYTRGGDAGQTRLATGARVSKSDLRVQLYGEVDELNSQMGLAIALLDADCLDMQIFLQSEQSLLFELGSELAGFKTEKIECVIYQSDIDRLEQEIDRMQAELEPMQAFILPGGSPAASTLHIARCVCRRVERQLVQVQEAHDNSRKENLTAELNPGLHPRIIMFCNRLSDYLFVAARYANQQAGGSDIKWISRARQETRVQK